MQPPTAMSWTRIVLPVVALLALASCGSLRAGGFGQSGQEITGTLERIRPDGLLLRTDEDEMVRVDLFPDPRIERALFIGERVTVSGFATPAPHQFIGRSVRPDVVTAGH